MIVAACLECDVCGRVLIEGDWFHVDYSRPFTYQGRYVPSQLICVCLNCFEGEG